MSCDRREKQAARAATTAGGIGKTGSRAAAETARNGDGGAQPGRAKKRRPAVRPATSRYRKLPETEKTALRRAVRAAGLGSEQDAPAALRQLVKQYDAGLAAAAAQAEARRLKKGGFKMASARMRRIFAGLGDAREAVKQAGDAKLPAKPAANDSKTPAALNLAAMFNRKELERLGVATLLGSVSAGRALKMLRSGGAEARGIGHSDPRPEDWLLSDRENFRFLSRALAAGSLKESKGRLDFGGLGEAERVDLWSFSRFEADRALRNIDHIQSGWSSLKGKSAEYLVGNHKLEARFYTAVAAALEPHITPEMRDKYGEVEV